MLIEPPSKVGGVSVSSGKKVPFLGLQFDRWDLRDTLRILEARPLGSDFCYLVTPNVDHIVRLADPALGEADTIRQAYLNAGICVCDSRVLSALARLRGVHLPVVPGSDLTTALFQQILTNKDIVAIVGSSEEALARLERVYPHIRFLQHIPPMGFRNIPEAMEVAADFVIEAKARFVFLSVGSPQQELLAGLISSRGGAVGVGLCVGAAIDFHLGLARRAPSIVQRMHMEWAHRLLLNPRRLWRRYLVDGPRIFWIVARWRRGEGA